ncbi:MAG: Ig-like domain-containing protein, partial [Sciscionella sp.]
HVRITLVRAPVDTVKDTTIAFAPTSADATLDLGVGVDVPHELFEAEIDYTDRGLVMFRGTGRVRSHATDESAGPPQELELDYVGPGANVTRMVVSPGTTLVFAGQSAAFTVAAFDADNNLVTDVPILWTTSDASLATIDPNGVLEPRGRRGSVIVTATTSTGISGDANVTITLPPAAITLLSGGGQTGQVAQTLATAAVVQVTDADGVGLAGLSVSFAAPVGGLVGGQVGAANVTTDANGRASTTLTLGTTAGPERFMATSGGVSTSIAVTATPGAPAVIAAVSGDRQTSTVGSLVSPLVVRVSDRFGNPIRGVAVRWLRATGVGALAVTTSTTNEAGEASTTYRFGGIVGDETVSASVDGVASPVLFTLHAVASAPAAIAVVAGDGQVGVVGTALASPLVVKVTDAAGAPVGGAMVSWTADNGTIAAATTTGADGTASNVLQLAQAAGPTTVTASIANGDSVSFRATAQPGAASPGVLTMTLLDGATMQPIPDGAPFTVTIPAGVTLSVAPLLIQLAAGTGQPAPNVLLRIDIGGGPGPTIRIQELTNAQGLVGFAGPIAAAGTYALTVTCPGNGQGEV